MEFIPLQDTEAIVYPGRNSSLYGIKKDSLSFEELDGVRLVQNYQDEFFDIGASGNSESFSLKSLDASVITNSDYIMERLLKNSDVVNISGSYLSENKKDTIPGIPLKMKGSRVIFGYIRHRGEEPDSSLREFIHFLEERIGSDK